MQDMRQFYYCSTGQDFPLLLRESLVCCSDVQVVLTSDERELLAAVSAGEVSVCLLDVSLGDSALALCAAVKSVSQAIPVIAVVDGTISQQMLARISDAGFDELLAPPFDPLITSARIQFAIRSAESYLLAAAKDEAEAANEAKNRMLAYLSYDIRTPMNVILGFTRMTLETELPPVARDNLNIVVEAGENLMQMLSELLDLSQMENGQLELHPEPVSMQELAASLHEALTPVAVRQEVQLLCDVSADLPPTLLCDGDRVRQILQSITGYMVSCARKGTVRVQCGYEQGDIAGLSVRFTASSIGYADHERLSAAFGDTEERKRLIRRDTALGMNVCTGLIALAGGSVSVSRAEGVTAVSLFLPMLPADAVCETAECKQATAGLAILLVEDNAVNRLYATRLLEKMGHSVIIAPEGEEALELLGDYSFDLVLMDIEMHGLDGLETTRIIRSGERPGVDRDIPVIAVTAHATDLDRNTCLNAGMNAYIAKPLTSGRLAAVIAAVAGVPQSQSLQRTQSPLQLLDTSTLWENMDGDVEGITTMFEMYLDECDLRISELEKLIMSGNAEEGTKEAHSQKGVLKTLGGFVVAEAVFKVETALRMDDTDAAKAAFAEYTSLHTLFVQQIHRYLKGLEA